MSNNILNKRIKRTISFGMEIHYHTHVFQKNPKIIRTVGQLIEITKAIDSLLIPNSNIPKSGNLKIIITIGMMYAPYPGTAFTCVLERAETEDLNRDMLYLLRGFLRRNLL